MIVYSVQDLEGNIMGIYEEYVDATDRLEELTEDGMEGVVMNDYLLNADVKVVDMTNVVQFR